MIQRKLHKEGGGLHLCILCRCIFFAESDHEWDDLAPYGIYGRQISSEILEKDTSGLFDYNNSGNRLSAFGKKLFVLCVFFIPGGAAGHDLVVFWKISISHICEKISVGVL